MSCSSSAGGEVSPREVAEERGWHIETVYRAIERLDDLVEHHYGELSLRSHHIAEKVTEYIQTAREGTKDAAQTLAWSLERDVGLELSNDALLEWFDRFGVERREAQLLLRFGRVETTRNDFSWCLTNGLYQWMKVGWSRERFENAEVDVRLKDGDCQLPAGQLLGATTA